ncbi:MAG: T9SS type A sorting domain-containing protein [Candidatus Coatesbacteria bacterium]|nr:T9SS type A sorting domain-containing protein [Candidatus Coatesbacteria bacterium]
MSKLLLTLILVGSITLCYATKFALSGSHDKTVKYWNLSNGICIKAITEIEDIYEVAISTDGKFALTCSSDKDANYYSLPDLALIRKLSGHISGIYGICFSNDGTHAATGSQDQKAKYWNLEDGNCIYTLDHPSTVSAVDINNNGKYLLTGCWDRQLRLFDLQDGTLLRTFTGHTSHITEVRFSSNSKYILSACQDYTMRYWDAETGQCLTVIQDTSQVYSAKLSPNGNNILSGNQWGMVRYWQTDGTRIMTFSSTHNGAVRGVDIFIDGLYGLSGGDDGYIKYFDITTGNLLLEIKANNIAVRSVAFNPVEGTGFDTKTSTSCIPYNYFSVTPNPFNTHLTLSLPEEASIYTITGRLVKKLSKGNYEIDTKTWKSGIYLLKTSTEIRKIIKLD